ncbi:hypothetical protein HK096_007420, partial [Nowakowskiella sp. JEL0078]
MKKKISQQNSEISKYSSLLENIKTLGGDINDLNLLGDVLSDDERDALPNSEKSQKSSKPVDNLTTSAKLSSTDVSDFLKELGWFPGKFDVNIIEDTNMDNANDTKEETETINHDNDNIKIQKNSKKSEKAQDSQLPADTQISKKLQKVSKKSEKAQDTQLPADTQISTKLQKVSKKSEKAQSHQLLIDNQIKWYSISLPELSSTGSQPTETEITSLLEKAQVLYEEEIAKFEKAKGSSSSDREFVTTILKSGTATDKISALTLAIQKSPFHAFKLLENNLITMAKKKAKREAILALDSIKDLMAETILPDRKLVNSSELSKDSLTHIRNKVMGYCYELLCAKPEQEQNLLSLLINKLVGRLCVSNFVSKISQGDQDRKLASRCTFLLLQVLEKHPNMQLVVIREIEHLIFRPNIADRAQYCAITFLNQVVLSRKDTDAIVPNKLIEIYFNLFHQLVVKSRQNDGADVTKKKIKKERHTKGKASRYKRNNKSKSNKKNQNPDENENNGLVAVEGVDAKMMAAVLTGVNRAFPFAKLEDSVFDGHVNTLFTVVHIGTFNTSVQSLSLIFQVQSSRKTLSDRFYRILYETLLDTRLYYSSKQAIYLNLLFRAMKADTSLNRVRAFIKRIIQTCAYTGGTSQVPLVCGSLFLVSEIMKLHKGLWSMVTLAEENDEDEHFEDHDEFEGSSVKEKKGKVDTAESESESDVKVEQKVNSKHTNSYDGRKRDPLYANANRTCLWELIQFSIHFHPTVSLYARTILSGSPIQVAEGSTNYDPLQNHTLIRFLDRFVYRNPKVAKTAYKGSSLMQPKVHQSELDEVLGSSNLVAGGRKKRSVVLQNDGEKVALDDMPVNSSEMINRDISKIPVDEVFFHRFFSEKQRQNQDLEKKKRKRGKDHVDVSDSGSDGFNEEEVWTALRKSSGFNNNIELEEDPDNDSDGMEAFDKMMREGSDDVESGSEDDNEDMYKAFGQTKKYESDDDEDENISNIEEDSGAENLEDEEMVSDSFDDEDVDMFEEAVEKEEKPASEKKPKVKNARLEKAAKALGYSGDYFSEGDFGEFASAEDFQDLIEQGYGSGHDEDGDTTNQIMIKEKKRFLLPLSGPPKMTEELQNKRLKAAITAPSFQKKKMFSKLPPLQFSATKYVTTSDSGIDTEYITNHELNNDAELKIPTYTNLFEGDHEAAYVLSKQVQPMAKEILHRFHNIKDEINAVTPTDIVTKNTKHKPATHFIPSLFDPNETEPPFLPTFEPTIDKEPSRSIMLGPEIRKIFLNPNSTPKHTLRITKKKICDIRNGTIGSAAPAA